jgi:acyl-CoA synthetase (AMP-forming)/AMP-acid ligase II
LTASAPPGERPDEVAEPGHVQGSWSTVFGFFADQAKLHPDRIALSAARKHWTYGQLLERVLRLCALFERRGVRPGDRVGVLSENRPEYLEVMLAAARLGACVACQNWRLSPKELRHCLDLVEPSLLFVSDVHATALPAGSVPRVHFGEEYEALLAGAGPAPEARPVDPEVALLILYTSGTTGLPKGAVISHRAEVVRNLVIRAEFGVTATDAFVAWSPLYHMGAMDPALGTLMSGGTVFVLPGFDRSLLCDVVAEHELGWLLLMPGMVQDLAAELERRQIRPKGVKLCGVMADLVPPSEIARITRLLGAPYANTFGATETGCPPCSSSLIPVGVAPTRLSKQKSPFCEIKLVDEADNEVRPGEPGQLLIRGPTLFSGYFRAEAATREAFLGGYYHMGDVFVQNPDGTLDFKDRVKYLIKSGGENIYPAEIERVILSDSRVLDAAVIRQPDAKWGEVPVAFVARKDESLDEAVIEVLCRKQLASFKCPKRVLFVELSEMPRSASGKIQRHELEKRLGSMP